MSSYVRLLSHSRKAVFRHPSLTEANTHLSRYTTMPRLPALDVRTYSSQSPHVLILGAGASRAALPHGDARGRRLPLMKDLVALLQLAPVLREAGVVQRRDEGFEALYDRLSSNQRFDGLRHDVEVQIRDYFSRLELPQRVTLYDQILGTLRSKDLVATFNWDPLLLQAYARNRDLQHLPRVVFLHGNVYLGYCPKDGVKGYSTQSCSICGERLAPSPLLYPVREKRYREHPLLAGEWEEFERTLERAYMVTILGYSAPLSDIAARDLLLQAWTRNPSQELAQLEIIDILPPRVLASKWSDFIVRQHYGVFQRLTQTWQYAFPRRSCEALAWATLQQDPWETRRLPRFRRLDRLKAWLGPLVDEEIALEAWRTPFEPFRPSGTAPD